MTHILFRPHVVGPENNVTTPDIIIDRATLQVDGNQHFLPVHHLSSSVAMQVPETGLRLTPAAAVVAAGGGALLSFAVIVQAADQPLALSDIILARSAWRLRNVIDHIESIQLELVTNTRSAATVPQPGEVLRKSASGELDLPRGAVALFAGQQAASELTAPGEGTVKLADDSLDRSLAHAFKLIPASAERWDERPLPRYTVGPVGEVQHYI